MLLVLVVLVSRAIQAHTSPTAARPSSRVLFQVSSPGRVIIGGVSVTEYTFPNTEVSGLRVSYSLSLGVPIPGTRSCSSGKSSRYW